MRSVTASYPGAITSGYDARTSDGRGEPLYRAWHTAPRAARVRRSRSRGLTVASGRSVGDDGDVMSDEPLTNPAVEWILFGPGVEASR